LTGLLHKISSNTSHNFKLLLQIFTRHNNWLTFTLMTMRPDLLPRQPDLFSVTSTVWPNSSTLSILASPWQRHQQQDIPTQCS